MQFKKHTALKQVCVCGVFIAISIIGSNLLFRRQHAPETGNPPLISKSAYRVSLTNINEQVATAHKSSSVDNIDCSSPSGHKYKSKTKWLVEQSTYGILPSSTIARTNSSLNRIIANHFIVTRPGYYLSLFRYALF